LTSARFVISLAVVVGIYVLAGKLGLRLAFVQSNATAVWPPTGIAIAALILLGPRAWPAIFAGAFIVNITTPATPVSASLGIAAGNALEALAASHLVRRAGEGVASFARPRHVFVFTAIVLVSTLISAAIGVLSLGLTGALRSAEAVTVGYTWWLGDFSGAMLITPAVLLWAAPARPGETLGRTAVVLLATLLTGVLVFGGVAGLSRQNFPIGFLVIPVLVWAACGAGMRATAAAILLLSSIAVVGTLQGFGPWARFAQNDDLLLLQAFMAVISVTTLALASAVSEHRRLARELQAARTDIEAALVFRDDFLGSASHELRTPLTVLIGNAELLARRLAALDLGAAPLLEPIREINAYARRLQRLVDDLLDASRVRHGRLLVDVQRVDLAELARVVIDRLRADPSTTPKHLLVLSAPAPVTGEWDEARMEQVLTNLVSNAIRYSPDGGTITVTVARTESGADLAVADNGIGIPEERMPRLFEPFTRLNEGERVLNGTGLGLYVAREIVTRHGGTIEVRSRQHEGTTFTVRLPLAVSTG